MRNLNCMQIFVIWAQVSWQLSTRAFIKFQVLKAKTRDQTGLVTYCRLVLLADSAICKRNYCFF